MNLLREDGFLLGRTGAFDNVLKIRPPLVFTPEHAEMLLDRARPGAGAGLQARTTLLDDPSCVLQLVTARQAWSIAACV